MGDFAGAPAIVLFVQRVAKIRIATTLVGFRKIVYRLKTESPREPTVPILSPCGCLSR
jgi:hypothetical protein